MSVDSTLFAADLPAGTYTTGDIVPLGCISGPANVRSGRGTAVLKRIFGGVLTLASGSATWWRIHVKNSDWIDEAMCMTADLGNIAVLDQHSGGIRLGNNDNLTPNSSWEVYAECVIGGTTTGANSIFALIDVDYPQVAAITDPDKLVGVPASIAYDKSLPINAYGTMTTSAFTTENVDYLKAGYQYALQEISIMSALGGGLVGFIALSNAAGMGGLTRIVPVAGNPAAIRQTIEYATILVKGPMDVKTLLFNTSSSTTTVTMIHDFVKRKA